MQESVSRLDEIFIAFSEPLETVEIELLDALELSTGIKNDNIMSIFHLYLFKLCWMVTGIDLEVELDILTRSWIKVGNVSIDKVVHIFGERI